MEGTVSPARVCLYVCVGLQRQDVIEDYVNYGSRVYAPILREGRFFDKNAQRCAALRSILHPKP